MPFTSLWANDNGSTSRSTINTNFTTAQSELDTKVEYSSTVPAIWDLVVAASTDWLSIKKKVFTASQTLESDSNGQPTSAAKGTAYNQNFGTGATDVAAWNLVVRNTGNETIAGVKTFSSSPLVPTAANATNDTTTASTAFVKNVMPIPSVQKFQAYTASTLATSFSVAHGLAAAPTYVKVRTLVGKGWWSGYVSYLVWEWTYKSGSYSTWYALGSSANPPGLDGTLNTNTSNISQFFWASTANDDDLTFSMTISSIDATNINFAITRTIGGGAAGNILFAIEFLA